MVLIMTPNNYLVILICSPVFLLSSFVSSQQNGWPIKDPLEFYNYAVSIRNSHPDYYAANYPKLSAQYNRMVRNKYEMKPMKIRTTTNSKQSKRDILLEKAAIRNVVPVPNIYGPSINRMPPFYYQSRRAVTQPKKINNKYSRSLDSTASPVTEAVINYERESPVVEERDSKVEEEWNQHCYMLGYNRTNNVCQSDFSEEIELAPNKEQCKGYIRLGCEYRSNQESCNSGVVEVLKNMTFDCRDINIDDLMGIQCCASCKGGINTAISADTCDMHSDRTLLSLASEFCCKRFLNPKLNESATESTSTTEKPMDAVIAMLDERLDNSPVNKPVEADTTTVSETSSPPTTSTATTATTATPAGAVEAAADTISTTTSTTTSATETTDTVTSPTPTLKSTTSTAENPSTTEITTTPTTTTPTTSTTTEPSVLNITTPPDTTPISSTPIPISATVETKPTRDLKPIDKPEGYKLLEDENNLYQKIDAKDKSKADYLVVLKNDVTIEKDKDYENLKLMNLTLQSKFKCDWVFNFEKAVAEHDGETLNEFNFDGEHEGSSFILLLNGKVEPQAVQYSVECNIQKYKYYKYQVYLNFLQS